MFFVSFVVISFREETSERRTPSITKTPDGLRCSTSGEDLSFRSPKAVAAGLWEVVQDEEDLARFVCEGLER